MDPTARSRLSINGNATSTTSLVLITVFAVIGLVLVLLLVVKHRTLCQWLGRVTKRADAASPTEVTLVTSGTAAQPQTTAVAGQLRSAQKDASVGRSDLYELSKVHEISTTERRVSMGDL